MMRVLLCLSLVLGCSRLSACGEEPVATVEPQLIEPERPAWGHRWEWAAVVLVDPAQAEVQAVDVPAAAGVAPPLTAAGEALPLDLSLVRDGLAGMPVRLFRAAPGQELELAVAGGDQAGETVTFVVPAPAAVEAVEVEELAVEEHAVEEVEVEAAQPEQAEQARWLVATDQGVHWLEWEEAHRVRELEVALGTKPWRVMVDVDSGQSLGEGRGDAEQAREEIRRKLAEQGIVVLSAPPEGEPLPVPWADLPQDQLDIGPLMRAAGQPRGWLLAQADREPLVVGPDLPLMLLRKASAYFQVDVAPRGSRGSRGPAARGGRGGGQGAGPGGGRGAGAGRSGQGSESREAKAGGGRGRGKAWRGQGERGQGGRGKAGRGKAGRGKAGRGGPPPESDPDAESESETTED